MNRKIQDSDALFIVARYKRDPYVFSARGEATKYEVSLRTIYNVLSKAGVKMRRGRKPLCSPMAPLLVPPAPAPLISPPAPEPLNPLDMLNLVNHLNHPKPPKPRSPLNPSELQGEFRGSQGPPITPRKPRRGPPTIRPNAR